MERRIFAVLVLMAAVAAYGSDSSVRLVDFDAQHFAGPMCFPGDPCGWPGIIQGPLNGPVCYPGDPCGPWPGGVQNGGWQNGLYPKEFGGPVCYPGDPCGPWPGGVRITVPSDKRIADEFIGPVCYPGDP